MSIIRRFALNTILILSLEFLCVILASDLAHGATPFKIRSNAAKPPISERVKLLVSERRPFHPSLPTFVITHGMGGTQPEDRFHQLADAIEAAIPRSNVILLDWSRDANKRTSFLGLPAPWEVAKHIDPVARDAAETLHSLCLDPTLTTFIGESFGNCVNARIAERLGQRGRILAFNPPNAAGGYKTPDLRTCADLAWSFQTYSALDTQESVAHVGFFLETSAFATERDQHVAGVSWLADRVRSRDMTWLLMLYHMTQARNDEFDAVAALSGDLLSDQHPPRERCQNVHSYSRSFGPLITLAP